MAARPPAANRPECRHRRSPGGTGGAARARGGRSIRQLAASAVAAARRRGCPAAGRAAVPAAVAVLAFRRHRRPAGRGLVQRAWSRAAGLRAGADRRGVGQPGLPRGLCTDPAGAAGRAAGDLSPLAIPPRGRDRRPETMLPTSPRRCWSGPPRTSTCSCARWPGIGGRRCRSRGCWRSARDKPGGASTASHSWARSATPPRCWTAWRATGGCRTRSVVATPDLPGQSLAVLVEQAERHGIGIRRAPRPTSLDATAMRSSAQAGTAADGDRGPAEPPAGAARPRGHGAADPGTAGHRHRRRRHHRQRTGAAGCRARARNG